jgi:hypothetical protein
MPQSPDFLARKMLEGSMPKWHRAYEVKCIPYKKDNKSYIFQLIVLVVIDGKIYRRGEMVNLMQENQLTLEKWIRDSLYDITIETDDIPF